MKFGGNSDNSKTNYNSLSRKAKDESYASINKLGTSDNLASLAEISGEKFYPAEVRIFFF